MQKAAHCGADGQTQQHYLQQHLRRDHRQHQAYFRSGELGARGAPRQGILYSPYPGQGKPAFRYQRAIYGTGICRNMPCFKALYTSFTGLSPAIAHEICYRAGGNADLSNAALDEDGRERLYRSFQEMMEDVRTGSFSPCIVYENNAPAEYAAVCLTSYPENARKDYTSISLLLEDYYAEKNTITRIRQRSSDLRRIVSTALERNVKKYDLQLKQMKDTEKRDKYRVYGELLNTYGYDVTPGSRSMTALNYYTNEEIAIPLDPTLTPGENAKKYFDKYNKLKRTYEALSQLTLETKAEIEHLESISNSLDIALKEEDLVQIKEELIESGYIRRKGGSKKVKITSRPFHYLSSDGYDIYVGKNNFQNDELTFKFAVGNDWWFHAKGIPGSHVVVKSAEMSCLTVLSRMRRGWPPTIPRDAARKRWKLIIRRRKM